MQRLIFMGMILMLAVPVSPFALILSFPRTTLRAPVQRCGAKQLFMGPKLQDVLHNNMDTVSTFSLTGAKPVDMEDLFHRGSGALRTLYHFSPRVVMVFFYKKGCSICHVFQPILERVVKEYNETGSIHFVDLEVMENPEITKEAGVSAVPGIHVYKEGKLIDVFRGVHCKRFLRNALDNLVAKHGLSNKAQNWASERIKIAQRESFFSSSMYSSILESQHEHIQQFPRPIYAWGDSNIVRTATHLGHAASLSLAMMSDAEKNKLRTMLPAFNVLPAIDPADPTRCIGDLCEFT